MKKSAPNKDGRTPRSVWSAPGLPALLQRPRLPAPPKCGSKLHAPSAGATYQVLLSGAKRLECVRLAGAFSPRATTSTTTHASKSGSKLHALQTLARGSAILGACLREAFGVRPACRRFFAARDHFHHYPRLQKREQAPRTPNAGAPFSDPRRVFTRSVWSASGLPALFRRARPLPPLPTPPKAGASSTHSKRWRAL